MTDSPLRPLTEGQQRVADLVSRGHDVKVIASRLDIAPATVHTHINAIATMLENPDDLPPYRLVMLWAAHQRWLREHHRPPKTA